MTVIRLIGVPAPSDGGSQAPTSPFTTRQKPTFHPNASPSNQVFPGKETIIVTRSQPGLVSDAPRARSPRPLFQQKSVSSAKWMEFPRYAEAYRNRPPAHRHSQTPCQYKTLCKILLPQLISRRAWAPPGPSTLGDWGLRAERLGRSLDAYTPAPSTPSSMGALVHAKETVTSPLKRHGMVVYFREGFRA